jgi:phosphonate transport system substrate-binding protein
MKKARLFIIVLLISISLPWASESTGEDNSPIPQKSLNMAYLNFSLGEVDIKDARVAVNLWSSEISKGFKWNLQINSFFLEDSAVLFSGLKEKKYDVMSLTILDYLKIKQLVDIEPAVGTIIGGKPGEEYALVTRQDKGGKNLEDLRNKKLIIQKDQWNSNIAPIWLDSLLLKQGLSSAKNFFSSIKIVDKPSQAVLPVFFRQTDVALVTKRGFTTMVELNPQLGAELQIVAFSPCFVTGVISFRRDISPEIKTQLVDSILKLTTLPRGKQILTLYKVDGFFPCKPTHFDSVNELIQEHKKKLTGNKNN